VWAESSRPALVRGRIGVEQARTRRDLAARELWPDLTLGAQYGQRPGEMGTERMGSLMLGFSVPVFAGQRQLQMRREAAAMEEMAEAELADIRAQVDARIGELIAELERARTLIALYRSEVLPQAGVNVSSALSGYRVGAVDFMTLVDAQMTVNEYREEQHALFAEYGRLIAELEMTVGREIPLSNPTLVEQR
jgi:outer membrane protein TolC